VIAKQSAKGAEFKKGWEPLSKFREDFKVWRQFGYLQ
jgi:hypothetical protein